MIILHHELIGLKVKVVGARNKSLMGMEDFIMDETQNTLTLNNGKKLLKSQVMLEIEGKAVDGSDLVGRTEDRIKKRRR